VTRALSLALDTENPLVQVRFRQGQPLTVSAQSQPLAYPEAPSLDLNPGDVVIISGGARGVTAQLARALAPYAPRLVLLGRSALGPPEDYERLLEAKGKPAEAARRLLTERSPELKGREMEAETARLLKGLEVTRTLKDLAHLGLEVSYYRADVADAGQITEVVSEVAGRFGRIDGIIHGAGVLKDTFMEFMTPADFARVMGVKLAGAVNLCQAARSHGLRFVAALSSVAAVQGNIGQVNYCAANRAMEAFLAAQSEPVMAKILILPPIEGTGMADDPEVKELLKLKGMGDAYVHVGELAELFCRELFLGPREEQAVMLARALPAIPATRISLSVPAMGDDTLPVPAMVFPAGTLPMLDRVERLDLQEGVVEAVRTFSLERDLWLDDHRPFKFLKHAPVSGIMAIETFLEAAHVLYPELLLLGVRQVDYQDLLACPPGVDRDARIVCRRQRIRAGEVVCQVTLSSPDLSPSGRQLERWSPNFQGQVALGAVRRPLIDLQGFPVQPPELETRPASQAEVLDWYAQRTDLRGRYRVMESLDGTSHGVVRGTTILRASEDFADRQGVRYHYSPYLFEAMMHLVTFYIVMRDPDEPRTMIPRKVTELRFGRPCAPGEAVTLEARLRLQEERGHTWDVQARSSDGEILMQAHGLTMSWFSD
jgi:NAD(P)-dependent dehydrogenase (short-subunit alcohol dehydrogenase family)